MKTIAIIITVVLITIAEANSQAVGPIRSYKNSGYSRKSLIAFISGKSDTSIAFNSMLYKKFKVGLGDTLNFKEENMDWALQDKYLFCEELTLNPGEYENSGWEPKTRSIKTSVGTKRLTDFFWIFRVGSYEIVLCKANCCNIINILKQKQKKDVQSIIPPKPNQNQGQQNNQGQATTGNNTYSTGTQYNNDGGNWLNAGSGVVFQQINGYYASYAVQQQPVVILVHRIARPVHHLVHIVQM